MALDRFFPSYLTALFFLFSIVFFDSSSSCLLVWAGICCQTVVKIRSERQHKRQGKSVNFFTVNIVMEEGGLGKRSSCFSSLIY